MNTHFQLNTPFIEAEEVKQKDLGQLISRYAFHWPLFVICITLSLIVAWMYLAQIKPVYHVRAKISIQDDKKKPESGKEAALQQLNLSTGGKLIESEVEVIKSRPLISKVVYGLGLWAIYKDENVDGNKDLYKSSPLHLELLRSKGKVQTEVWKVSIISARHFEVTTAEGKKINVGPATRIRNSSGEFSVIPSVNISDYIGHVISITIRNPEQVVTAYQNNITTTINSKAPILELSLDDELPQRGIDVLNYLVTVYKNFNIIDKNKETQSTLKFIDTRLASLTGELTAVEKDVEGYKSSIGLTDISSKSQFYLDNVQNTDNRLNEVDIQLNVINGLEKYVNSEGSSGGVPATVGITDPGMINLVAQLSALQLKKEKLLAITPEQNPIFEPIDKEIASLRIAIKRNLRSVKSSLVGTKRQLSSFNSQFEEGIKSMPGQERQYITIKRQQAIKENLYVYLLQKREEVSLSYAATLTDARVVEQAFHGEPESQKKIPILLALLTGFIMPLGIITLRSNMRNRVMTRKDIELATSAPVMVELLQDKNAKPIVVLNRNAYALGEQMRGLRTDILQTTGKKKSGRVVMFLSSIAGEGKSFVASNIAVSLAAMGKKTVILELDLRKPKISRIFKLDQYHPGLSDYLNGVCSHADIIQPSGIHKNLDVMGSGAIPDDPSELIQSQNMVKLIAELRKEYDNVIIDSPPLHLVTDAMILAPMVDVCLYIIRHNYTPKTELNFIQKQYMSGKLPNMHLVFNGVEMDSRFGYAIDYGYYQDKPDKSLQTFFFSDFKSRF
ncbi:MAG TPA: polysaccharide biosynthesis tyrosine autokinase [Pedobacter sp.]|nr:polysaccharide biosynthesis tyrosine autokinase [Pedobacter sp.]